MIGIEIFGIEYIIGIEYSDILRILFDKIFKNIEEKVRMTRFKKLVASTIYNNHQILNLISE